MPLIISSAPGVFQRTMNSLMQGIRDVVLGRLKKAGMWANKAKCSFFTYLGYNVDCDGIHSLQEKVKAVKDAPEPKNVTELNLS